MMIMPANSTGIRTGYWAGRFPGRIGHLYSPGGERGPWEFMPYGIDNGVFAKGPLWSEDEYFRLLEWARRSGQPPLWNLVPDTVGDRDHTLRKWDRYYYRCRSYGWALAFAVQDGMTPGDVPSEADVVFVGGSTEWKWKTVSFWCAEFDHVHVGRVNTYRRLWQCHDAGAKSADGTGFNRGDQLQTRGILAYLEESSGLRKRHIQQTLAMHEQEGVA
jgi:hypothetical protein